MDISEEKLREFESTLKEIRDAALSDAQIFSDRSFRKGMAWMSFAFGILIAAFCVAGALLFGTGAGTSLSASLMLWAFVLLFVAGGILKFVLVSRVTARQNKSLRSSLQVIYGRGPLAATLASFISVAVAAVFFISTGMGELVISLSAIFIAFCFFALDVRIRLPEFRIYGWALLVTGLGTLFFVQRAPWLCGAIVWAVPLRGS